MTGWTGVVSAIGLLLLTFGVAAAFVRFLIWRERLALQPRRYHDRFAFAPAVVADRSEERALTPVGEAAAGSGLSTHGVNRSAQRGE